ncbi:MAG: sigma-70 family RNA polymerase sigma factor [Planctomycetota bacterium]
MISSHDQNETRGTLERLRTGGTDALSLLFEAQRPYLRQVVEMRLDGALRRRVDASDILQDAHAEAARRLDDYLLRAPMPPRLWLRKTTQECFLKARRRHLQAECRAVRREVPLPDRSSLQLADLLVGTGTTPSGCVRREERARCVREALDRLTESDRELVLILDVEGLSSREAAVILDVDRSTVSRRHGRALLRLHAILRELGVTESKL